MIDWRRPVVFAHRWLGITLGLLFAIWFASGIVMMYARMPDLGAAQRLAHLAPLDLSTAVVPLDILDSTGGPGGLEEAARGAPPERVRVGMLLGRPVYRVLVSGSSLTGLTVFADTGERLRGLSAAEAVDEARRFAPEHARTIRYDVRLTEPDQWTLEARALLPLHRIALGDADGSDIYLAERTGEVVLETTRRERRVAYAGAVLHWIYFTPFRRHTALWSQSIVWLSLAGSVMCALGLVWGVYNGIRPPYRGWMRWHHYAGLAFGVVSFTWVFSGLLSMDPWNWQPATTPTATERSAFSGGPLRLHEIAIESVRSVVSRLAAPPKEVEIVQFRGQPRLLVDGHAPHSIGRDLLLTAARDAVPGATVQDAAWLDAYDWYYYDRHREQPLPVLRVRYADPRGTWLYVDPNRGTILRKEERLSRLNRWLYHGLHSLDFPFLYGRRPLWDIVVILLSLGGIASAVTAVTPAWRRLRRHARRLYS
jgi:hypothetical protein